MRLCSTYDIEQLVKLEEKQNKLDQIQPHAVNKRKIPMYQMSLTKWSKYPGPPRGHLANNW
jgi:hypothetical protein